MTVSGSGATEGGGRLQDRGVVKVGGIATRRNQACGKQNSNAAVVSLFTLHLVYRTAFPSADSPCSASLGPFERHLGNGGHEPMGLGSGPLAGAGWTACADSGHDRIGW